jgi:curved DNA-binding protein CbpA
MSKSGEYVFAWLEALDHLTYYELFGVADDATADDVQGAFHAFCDTFHPDQHVGRPASEREALSAVFCRGTEAFHVLSDPALRAQYDGHLAAAPGPQPPRIRFSPLSRPPSSRSAAPASLEEAVRSPTARPFARRAEELLRKGDLRQAKLQLVLANHMDPGNGALESALRDVEARLR